MNDHDVNGRIRAGEVEIEIHCDSTQLDEALRKMELLITKAEHAKSLGVLPMGILAASLAGSPRQLTRRSLVCFDWFGGSSKVKW